MPEQIRFYAAPVPPCLRFKPLLLATVAAATLSTVVQVLLWLVFTDAFPAVLFRDARLAAAIVLGPTVLPPPASFDLRVMALATVVHFALSFIYTALVGLVVEHQSPGRAAAAGALFGLALYLVNMYGFTRAFPWFVQTRDWITATAHIAFGLVAAVAYRQAARPRDA